MKLIIHSLSEIDTVAQKFVEQMDSRRVYAFYGEMGVGKTTFIKAICSELGVKEEITSPTFAIINEYTRSNNEPIYHFDFYRINNVEEAFDFGYEDYFYSGHLCLIEWPELIEPLLPDDVVKVKLTLEINEERSISVD